MSVLNQSGEEQVECPLCMEPLEVDDLHFYPCTCGYQICRFCWNRIREGENGLCPACRKAYPENPADFTPLSQEQVAAIKTEKKAREQKRRNKTLESRRALANVRVVQNNLVFVVGLPVRLADPEILKRQEYFGKYGKIHKVVINQSTTYAGSQGPSASAYVTYVSPADALRAIQGVNNVTLDGRVLKGSLGTTKYCANFMKNQPCPKADCMYLHELGDPKASFTKEEMHAGLHQVYERKLHNQLLAQTQQANSAGNSSTNGEKGSSKDGNPSNFIPTTVVTSSHINVVNSTKSNKKECTNGGSSSSSSSSGKEAWPSLGASPPALSPRKPPSPKPDWPNLDRPHDEHKDGKSQENGTSESSSPTQMSQPPPAPTKSKDSEPKHSRKHENNTQNSNSNNNGKKNKNEKQKPNKSNSIPNEETEQDIKAFNNTQTHSVFENETTNQYLSNELDELESDRHSLLENHDLLDNSDHSLLEDDNTHNLLNDANNEVLMMQRHREMLAGLVDNNISNHMMHVNKPLMNGYGLMDRDVSYERGISQMEQKELLMRPEMLRHTPLIEPKHYMPTNASIGLESASELLGANFHPNPNILPPFGMRVDNSMGNSCMANNSMGNSLAGNSMTNSIGNTLGNTMGNTMANSMGGTMTNSIGNSLGNTMGNTMANSIGNKLGNTMANSIGNTLGNAMGNTMANSMGNSMANSMGNSMANSMGNTLGNSMGNAMGNSLGNTMGGYMLHNQQMMQNQQHLQSGLVNGFDNPQNTSEGRYLAENMDKFFTDFHKAQQMRLQILGRSGQNQAQPQPQLHYHTPHNMLSAERLEMEHKQRMSTLRGELGRMGGAASGDADDDLDFDPFKETQKALAEMMETEMMQTGVSSGDNMERVRRSRLPPPGFGPVSSFAPHQQRLHTHPQDWTQMDPAIMSTSVNFPKQTAALSPQQQELFARFNHLQLQPNGVNKIQMPLMQQWASGGNKLGWGYNSIPLPPGFAPAKPQHPAHPAECIDAK